MSIHVVSTKVQIADLLTKLLAEKRVQRIERKNYWKRHRLQSSVFEREWEKKWQWEPWNMKEVSRTAPIATAWKQGGTTPDKTSE